MKTETTPLTDKKEYSFFPVNRFVITSFLARHLERSRRRNIRRAWRLRKEARSNRSAASYWKEWSSLFVEQFSSRFAEQFNKITDQRDRAIAIAQEALGDGHRYPCYADEREPTIRCRCGWREEKARLEKLKGEISKHGNPKTNEDCLDSNPIQ